MNAKTKQVQKLVKFFNLDLKLYGNKYIGPCPVHGGDNVRAFNLYPVSGIWRCWSHQCEGANNSYEHLESLLLKKHGLNKIGDVSIEQDLDIPKIVSKEFDALSIGQFLKDKIFPCKFFSKKYGEDIAKKFYIGYCGLPKNPMCKRSVVPVLSLDGKSVVGWQGRSIFDECPKCNSYHLAGIQCSSYYSPKWKMAKNFSSSQHLYNSWNALPASTIYVTESVGNVFIMDKMELHNTVATLGVQFSIKQRQICLDNKVERIIYVKDMGGAGDLAAARIKKVCGNKIEVIVPELDLVDDIAATTGDKLKKAIDKLKEV